MELNNQTTTDSFELFKTGLTCKSYNYDITNSMLLCEYHKYYNSKYDKITRKQFSDIYKCITDNIIDHLHKYLKFRLPCGMGVLAIRYVEYKSYYKDGLIKTNRPVDWYKTLKLWHDDAESLEDKTLVRSDKDGVHVVYYDKSTATYTDKTLYKFQFTRKIKKQLNIDYYER